MANKLDYNFSPIKLDKAEKFKGYPLIGPDMDVRGGVFYAGGGEAIIVDPWSDPTEYRRYFRDALRRTRGRSGGVDPSKVPRAVYDTVVKNMPTTRKNVKYINEEVESMDDGQLVELSAFLRAGGTCRHQALAIAATLEEFKDRGHIDGTISVEVFKRAHIHDENDVRGHAWVRYTEDDNPLVLDPAQGFYGTLEESVANKKLKWSHLRPEEELDPYYQDLALQSISLSGLELLLGKARETAADSAQRTLLMGRAAASSAVMGTVSLLMSSSSRKGEAE